MSVPYDQSMIRHCLRAMPSDRLASITPAVFQTHPVQVLTPWKLIEQFISNEQARRAA